jgi:hypothetical protein
VPLGDAEPTPAALIAARGLLDRIRHRPQQRRRTLAPATTPPVEVGALIADTPAKHVSQSE